MIFPAEERVPRTEGASPLPRVSLRPLEDADIPLIQRWLWEGHADGFFLGDEPCAQAGANLYAAALLTSDLYFAIRGEQDEFLGIIGVKDRQAGGGEFFISLLREAKGKGIAQAAGKQFLSLLFSGYREMNQVFMFTFEDNQATIRFNLRMGFTPVESRGETMAGRPICRFRCTRADWEKRKGKEGVTPPSTTGNTQENKNT